MNHTIRAIYHLLLLAQYGIWTTNPFKGHVVLKVKDHLHLGFVLSSCLAAQAAHDMLIQGPQLD